MTRWRKSMFAAILLLAICSWGCGLEGGEEEVINNQTIRIAETEEFTSMDPALVVDGGSFILANHLYEGLMRIGRDQKPVAGLAEKVEISPDRKVYTFTLRDAKWSDGELITAEHFEIGWKRVMNPATKSEYAYMMFPIDQAEEYHLGKVPASRVGVKALDRKTLQVILKTPMINFLDYTILPAYLPVRTDQIAKLQQDPFGHPEQIAYSGPFILQRYQSTKLTLVKNKQYWDQQNVHLKQVELHQIKDVGTALNLYQTGRIDLAPVSSAFIEKYRNSPELIQAERATSIYMVMNTKGKLTKNRQIRQAISLALDRGVIASRILKDGSQPAGALVHPAIAGLEQRKFRQLAEQNIVSHDSKQATAAFQQGLKELGLTKPPAEVVLLVADSYKEIAAVLQEQLRVTLGLQVTIETPTAKVIDQRKQQGEYDLTISAWGADYNDAMAYLELWNTDEKKNIAGFDNRSFNQLLQRARQETDANKRFLLMKKAEQMLVREQVVIAPIYFRYSSLLQKPYVKNYVTHPIGADYSLKWVKMEK